jgi:hypothetical protein
MPKPQKVPTERRLLGLLDGRPIIRCDHPDEPPDALSELERRGIDTVCRLFERGISAVTKADLANSADAEAELMRELHQIGAEIGEMLQQLNPSGIFLRAHRDQCGTCAMPQPGIEPEVTMQVLRR